MARTAVGAAVLAICALVLSVTGCNTGERVDLGGGAGGALIAAIAGEPDQLDPHKTTAYFSFEVLENVFDTLVEPDENLRMQPALAESWEVRKDAPTKWVFKLRKGVVFHDGSPFNADAVVFTFESIKKRDAPHFDPYGSGQVGFRLASLVAVTKIDRVPRSQRSRCLAAVASLLASSRDLPQIPVSAQTGEGLPELWRELAIA